MSWVGYGDEINHYLEHSYTHTQTHTMNYIMNSHSRVEKLGYPVPVFDFRLPGVTSMSADIHKYGLGTKVTSSGQSKTQPLF